MSSITEQLVSLSENVRFEALPPSTVHAAKRAIIDALGCAIAAIGCEPAQIASRVVPKGSAEATVIGERGRGSVERAVLVNGVLLRYLDMMDVYWDKDICHPAENVTVALACVEGARGTGPDLIAAVVAAYEAQCRLAQAVSLGKHGMHHVTAAGIVAPLVIGKVWRMDADAIAQAVALAGCRQFTLHALSKGGLSMAKAIGYAWSAMTSVMAARLAREGFTGPVDFLDWLAKEGADRSSFDRSALEADGRYLIEQVSFKQFPVQFELQTPVEIAVRMKRDIAGAEIASLYIDVPPAAIGRVADPAKFKPANRETADHSLPVCTAMALLDGELTAEQFERDRWAADEVAALVAKTTVHANAEYATAHPGGRPAGLRVRLADGRELSDFQAIPTGDAQQPLDDLALERKFMSNAAERVGRDRARETLETLKRLEHLVSIDELTTLLAAT